MADLDQAELAPTPTERASKRGRANRVKGRNHTLVVRKLWEAAIGPLVATQQELGADDLLDVVNGISIECKSSTRNRDLPGWTKQAADQAEKRGGLIPVVVNKREGTTDAGRYYVIIELRFFVALIHQLKRGRS